MSSPYSILNDRPVDQWKVTELKEELRRRRLKTNGLKEELVRRLDGALRSEMEEAEKEELGNGLDPDNDPEDKIDEEDSEPAQAESDDEPVGDKVEEGDEKESPQLPTESNAEPVDNSSGRVDNDAAIVDNIDSTIDVKQGTVDEDQKEVVHASLGSPVDTTENTVPLGNNVTDSHIGLGQLESSDQGANYEKNKESKPSAEDVAHAVSETANQVSEVSPDLGLKSESFSTDSVSINEKNELKDNLNANNVNLELEVVKPEMVQPSSSDVPTIGGDSHPLEDAKELVDNQASLEEVGDVTCATDMEVCRKIEGVDGGSPEKLNLDRSSGDESMEEDIVESKQIESKNNSEQCERKEDMKHDMAQVTKPNEPVVSGFSSKKRGTVPDEESKPIAVAEKRKAEGQEAVNINNEPKRRRWNIDTAKATEPQMCNVVTSTTPKDAFQPALRKSFSRSDSSLSADAPKERIVPPSQKPATTSLRIDRFLRPFTLKAVQELLAKTGTVTDFWMDQIKTHCYVTYSSVEEATTTRNALYNLQWPTNGGRLLMAEFVDPQEVKTRVEAPPQSPAPVTPSATTPTALPFQRQPQAPALSRPVNLRQQQLPPPPPLPPPPALSNPPPARERLPPPPPPPKVQDPPIMTLDDLFKKTKATPRIYYLPLNEEQVAAKLQAGQGKRAQGGGIVP